MGWSMTLMQSSLRDIGSQGVAQSKTTTPRKFTTSLAESYPAAVSGQGISPLSLRLGDPLNL